LNDLTIPELIWFWACISKLAARSESYGFPADCSFAEGFWPFSALLVEAVPLCSVVAAPFAREAAVVLPTADVNVLLMELPGPPCLTGLLLGVIKLEPALY
jgi:hypothetical protein